MVLSYVPCKTLHFYDVFDMFIKLTRMDKDEHKNIFYEMVDDGFCKFIFKKGGKRDKMCMKKSRYGDCLCYTHRYQVFKMKCTYNNCDKYKIKDSNLCAYHNKIFYYKNYNSYFNIDKEVENLSNIDIFDINQNKKVAKLNFYVSQFDVFSSSLNESSKNTILYNKFQSRFIFNNNIFKYLDTKYEKIYKYIYILYNKNSNYIINEVLKTNDNN